MKLKSFNHKLALPLLIALAFSQTALAQTVHIAFGANIKSQVSIGRDAPQGIDMFLGDLDVVTGRVSNIKSVDTGTGAQWFPAFSPDGTLLAYTVSDQRVSHTVILNLTTQQQVGTLSDARFPSFSNDGKTLYFSQSGPQAGIYSYNLSTKTISVVTSGNKQDPALIDDHTLAYHEVVNQQAQPIVLDLNTKIETRLVCALCGHLAATSSMLLTSLPSQAGLMLSQRNQAGGTWSSFNRLNLSSTSSSINLSQTIAAYPQWIDSAHTLVSMMPFTDTQPKKTTQASFLYLMTLNGSNASLSPVTFDGYPNAQACTSAVVASSSQTATTPITTTPIVTPITQPAGQPLLYVVINSRNHDPQFRGESAYAQDLQAYQNYREQLLLITRFYKQKNIPWTFQTDWNFVEGVLAHEVKSHAINLSETNNVNLLQYLSQNGVNVEPYSHETQGYNYADVAALIEQAGVKPMPAIGGHLYDAQDPNFQNWPRFITGLTGQKFPSYTFKAQMISGAATYKHQNQTAYSGIWRPKSKEAFFTHDPAGQMISVADEKMNEDEIKSFVTSLQSGKYPSGRMYVASISTTFAKQMPTQAVEAMLNKKMSVLLELQNQGLIKIVDYLDLPKIWKEKFNEQGNVVVITETQNQTSPQGNQNRGNQNRPPRQQPGNRNGKPPRTGRP